MLETTTQDHSHQEPAVLLENISVSSRQGQDVQPQGISMAQFDSSDAG